jgi:hypothetical protein
MCGRGLPRWWTHLLEMLSTCTCYSRLHWWWFGYVSPSYYTTWSYLVLARTYLVLTRPRVGSLLFHMIVFYWHTCHVTVGSCVTSSLDHVSYFYFSTWSFSYSTTSHGADRTRFVFLFGHVAWRLASTCRILIAHMSCPGYFTCCALVRLRVVFLFDHVVYPSSTPWSTINSS